MARFLAGLLVGMLLGGGGAYFVFARKSSAGPTVAAAAPDAGVADPGGKKKAKGRGAGGVRRGGDLGGNEEFADEPIPELSAADLAMGAEGDSLKPRPRDVDLSNDTEVRDLTSSEINGAIGASQQEVTDCITQARGPAPVTGTITVGMIVDPEGRVLRSRVEAPSWLLRHGLYRCVRRAVSSLRFPSVGKDTVVTFPVNLN